MAWPHHKGLIHGVSQLEDVVADSQVVLQSKGLQHHPIPYREGQAQVIAGVSYRQKSFIHISYGKKQKHLINIEDAPRFFFFSTGILDYLLMLVFQFSLF